MAVEIHIAVIGIPGAWSSEIIKTSFEKLNTNNKTFIVDIFKVGDLSFDIQSNKVYYQSVDLESYTAVIIKKLGEYAPRILDWLDIFSNIEDKGLPFFSSPKKLRQMISRIGCTKGLAAANIPMPNTLITENSQVALDWIAQRTGAVFKPNFSTKARGMQILKADTTTIEALDTLRNKYGMLYLQELMQLPGKDFGIVFSGDQYLGTYARVAAKDSWNTTTKDGGHYESFEPTEEMMSIAKKAQAIFNLDFCCVDIAETQIGPIVFEVSAFGGFKGMYHGANINSADILSNYILEKISL